jgi:ferredoxin
MSEALREKGAEVLGGIVIRGECFHPFPALNGRFPGRPNKEDLRLAKDFGVSIARHLKDEKQGPLVDTRKDVLAGGHGFYDFLAVSVGDDDLRKILKPPETNKDLCDQCGWCAAECPTRSITIDPYPKFQGDTCIRCYRCYSGCPEKAIVSPILIGNLMSHAFYNTFFERYLGDVKKGESFYKK